MSGPTPSLEQLKVDVQSDKQEVRGRAMRDLLLLVQKDPASHLVALPLFWDSFENPRDGWTINNALRGIEHIEGPQQAREIRLTFFDHPREELVRDLVQDIHDPSYVTPLIDLLARRPELKIRISTIRTLGRLRDSAVVPVLAGYLNDHQLRPHIVEALSEQRDVRAIPYLEALLPDTTPAWEEDNHGPMLRVCDLANQALKRLRTQTGDLTSFPHPPPALLHAHPIPFERKVSPPPPLPYAPVRHDPGSGRWAALPIYFPLIAAVCEVPWVAFILFIQLFTTGKISTGPGHALDAIAAIPALAGIAFGGIAIVRRQANRWWEWFFLILGCLVCALPVFSFGYEFFH